MREVEDREGHAGAERQESRETHVPGQAQDPRSHDVVALVVVAAHFPEVLGVEEIEPERGALDLVLVAQLFRVRVRVRDREAPVRRGRVGALGRHEDGVVPGPPAVARVEDRPEPVGVDEMAEPVRLVGRRAGRRGRKPDQAVVTADVVVAHAEEVGADSLV